MLVSSAVVRRLRGDIGDISMSQIWRQQHLHLPPELTVGSSIIIFQEVVFPGDLLYSFVVVLRVCSDCVYTLQSIYGFFLHFALSTCD